MQESPTTTESQSKDTQSQLLTRATASVQRVFPKSSPEFALSVVAGAANDELRRQLDTKLSESLHNASPDELRDVLAECTQRLAPKPEAVHPTPSAS